MNPFDFICFFSMHVRYMKFYVLDGWNMFVLCAVYGNLNGYHSMYKKLTYVWMAWFQIGISLELAGEIRILCIPI